LHDLRLTYPGFRAAARHHMEKVNPAFDIGQFAIVRWLGSSVPLDSESFEGIHNADVIVCCDQAGLEIAVRKCVSERNGC
jgi:hypothetical protein